MRLELRIALLFCILGTTNLYGQAESEFADLIQNTESLIEKSLNKYQAFLQQTSSEKLALMSDINALENELIRLRRESREARSITEQKKAQLESINIRIQNLDTQSEYAAGILSEYLTNFESRINIAEDQAHSENLKQIRAQLDKAGDSLPDRIHALFQAVDAGLERQERLVGGHRFPGRAITPLGGVKSGEVALIGPVAYFRADDRSVNGILVFNSGTIEPGLKPLSDENAAMINEVFDKNAGHLPLDASLGKALSLEKAKGTLIEHVEKGGWVGYSILALGFAAILVSIFKIFDLRKVPMENGADIALIARLSVSRQKDAANTEARKIRGPIAAIIAAGIEFAQADSETMLDAMDAVIIKNEPRLERFLPFLATTAAMAPLMGLLGTVVGMIKTFTLIEVFGTGDAKSLSSGISEALITTELGLVVAIPALVFHGLFSRFMRSRIGAMEQIASDFGRHLAREKTATQ